MITSANELGTEDNSIESVQSSNRTSSGILGFQTIRFACAIGALIIVAVVGGLRILKH